MCDRCESRMRRKMIKKDRRKHFVSLVGERYASAVLDDLGSDVRLKIVNLPEGKDMFLTGGVGRGKTWAMAAMIKHYLTQGYVCKRINFDEFCVKVRSTFNSKSQSEWQYIKPYIECDMLFIDDLGLRKTESDFAYVTLYSLLNKRQESMLSTIISSNRSLSQLKDAFDSRIESRMSMAEIIEFTGPDRRKQ